MMEFVDIMDVMAVFGIITTASVVLGLIYVGIDTLLTRTWDRRRAAEREKRAAEQEEWNKQ